MDEALEEADRRIAEGEKQIRHHFEETYEKEAKTLENDYQRNFAAFNEDHRQQLELYQESLKTQPLDMKAFSSLAKKLLIPNGT